MTALCHPILRFLCSFRRHKRLLSPSALSPPFVHYGVAQVGIMAASSRCSHPLCLCLWLFLPLSILAPKHDSDGQRDALESWLSRNNFHFASCVWPSSCSTAPPCDTLRYNNNNNNNNNNNINQNTNININIILNTNININK